MRQGQRFSGKGNGLGQWSLSPFPLSSSHEHGLNVCATVSGLWIKEHERKARDPQRCWHETMKPLITTIRHLSAILPVPYTLEELCMFKRSR
jgi:hypothetical protein